MKLKKKSVRLTPERALYFLRCNTFLGQRNIKVGHLSEIRDKIADGRFHEGLVAVINNGKADPTLVDGQHTCQGVIDTGKSVDVRLHEWFKEKGDTETDVARVYAQYIGGKERSRADVAWAFGSITGMEEWPKKCVRVCASALSMLAAYANEGDTGKAYNRDTKEQHAGRLFDNRKECDFVRKVAYDGSNHRHLYRKAVVAAMMVTWRRSQDDAELFWIAVRDGDMLKRTEPAFRCREFLLSAVVRTARGGNGQVVDEREMYAKCIHWWNAFRGGKGASGRYYPDAPLPKAK